MHMITTMLPSPPYDPELAGALTVGTIKAEPITAALIPEIQSELGRNTMSARQAIEDEGLVITDYFARCDDGHALPLHHISDPRLSGPSACIYYIHGGGMVLGTPWDGSPDYIRWIKEFSISVVTVDYRLSPTWSAPTLVEDCYAGLRYVHSNAVDLGIDPRSIVVAGISAGGGLAAGVCLIARDREFPPVLGQMLLAPMLDSEAAGDSTRQFPDATWNVDENQMAWGLVLGSGTVTDAGHNVPAQAESLGLLPPAFLEVGSAEIFRTEVIDYATRIWREGGVAELHVWAGGFHGFEAFPHTAVTQGAFAAQSNWLSRTLGFSPRQVNTEP